MSFSRHEWFLIMSRILIIIIVSIDNIGKCGILQRGEEGIHNGRATIISMKSRRVSFRGLQRNPRCRWGHPLYMEEVQQTQHRDTITRQISGRLQEIIVQLHPDITLYTFHEMFHQYIYMWMWCVYHSILHRDSSYQSFGYFPSTEELGSCDLRKICRIQYQQQSRLRRRLYSEYWRSAPFPSLEQPGRVLLFSVQMESRFIERRSRNPGTGTDQH